MKPGKDLSSFVYELARQKNASKDYLVSTTDMVMDADIQGASLSWMDSSQNTQLVGITDTAHNQIAQTLGIPIKYYDKMLQCNPDLLAENVNAWFSTEPRTRMVRTLDGNARAFLSEKYRRIDNFDLAENILPILNNLGVSYMSNEVTASRMYIKVVNERIQKEVRVGDIVQSGLIISNSEVGVGTVTIQPLLYRLVCTNGMIVNDFKGATRRRHVGKGNLAGEDYVLYASDTLIAEDHALMLKIRDTISASLDEVHFSNLIDNMKEAAETKIETTHIPEMVELASSEFGYTKKEGEGILDYLIRGGDLTLYGLSNAVTRYAQDVDSYDRSTELEAIGYDILTMPGKTWRNLNKAEF